MKEFDTEDLVIVRKLVNLSIKYGIAQKLVFKTKGPYIVLYKATPSSYRLQRLPFCEGLVRPGRKVKESAARMENIPSTMLLHKHLDGEKTRFSTMEVPLANNPLVKWIEVIRRGT